MKHIHIENEEDYEAVSQQIIERLKDAEPGTDEAKQLKTLMNVLVTYEYQQIQIGEK